MQFTQDKREENDKVAVYLQINKKNLIKSIMLVDKDKGLFTAKVECVPDCGMDALGKYFDTVFCTGHSAYTCLLDATTKAIEVMGLSDKAANTTKQEEVLKSLKPLYKTGYVNLTCESPACINTLLVAATAAWSTMLEYIVKLYKLRAVFTGEKIKPSEEFGMLCNYDAQIDEGLKVLRADINSITNKIVEDSLRHSIRESIGQDD